jgi:3-dehydroquinate dehydratase-2|tara:strand:- start:326 stop:772 length:447 start_codon:yes stop_codon:yes gene_type:complete
MDDPMTKNILVLNGPNLNLLGKREPAKYGSETLADVQTMLTGISTDLGLTVQMDQSNSEGTLVDMIHAARETCVGILINPGAYSHTSIAILDALNAFDGAVIEVHITNIHAREEFRHHSFVSARANAVIAGCGTQGYAFALRHIATLV